MVSSRTALHHLKSWSRPLKPETAPDSALTEVFTMIKYAILYRRQLTLNIEVVFFWLFVNQWINFSEITKTLCVIQIYYKHIYSIYKKILNYYIMWNCGMIYSIELNACIIQWDKVNVNVVNFSCNTIW